jgi:hypothetical protein
MNEKIQWPKDYSKNGDQLQDYVGLALRFESEGTKIFHESLVEVECCEVREDGMSILRNGVGNGKC